MRRLFGTKNNTTQILYEPLERGRVMTAVGSLAVVDEGKGPPILFLHGGIVASDFWRDIVPAFTSTYRCIAIDLPGTGHSVQLDDENGDPYELDVHVAAVRESLAALGVNGPIVLVVHGWASMVGFRWAAHHSDRIRAIVQMESIVGPLAWPNLPDRVRAHLRMARTSPAAMYSMDYFERAMETEVFDPLAQPVVDAYRSVWEGGHRNRQAHLSGLRQIPISGQPSKSHEIVLGYQAWLQRSLVPKLMVLGRPGMLISQQGPTHRLWNQTVVGVVGAHLLVEESPQEVALFLGAWLRQHVT